MTSNKQRKEKPQLNISQLISRELDKRSETKKWYYTHAASNLRYYSDATWDDGNLLPLGPSVREPLVQGTSQNERVGNKIRIKKATATLIFFPSYYSANYNAQPTPLDIRLSIVHSKVNPTDTTVGSAYFSQMGGSTAPTDELDDLVLDINRDSYVVHMDKTIKLGCSYYIGTGGSAGNQYYSNNDYPYNNIVKMDVTSCFPKIMDFDDDNDTPRSFNPYLVILQCKADGTSPDIAVPGSSIPAKCTVGFELEYTDA